MGIFASGLRHTLSAAGLLAHLVMEPSCAQRLGAGLAHDTAEQLTAVSQPDAARFAPAEPPAAYSCRAAARSHCRAPAADSSTAEEHSLPPAAACNYSAEDAARSTKHVPAGCSAVDSEPRGHCWPHSRSVSAGSSPAGRDCPLQTASDHYAPPARSALAQRSHRSGSRAHAAISSDVGRAWIPPGPPL